MTVSIHIFSFLGAEPLACSPYYTSSWLVYLPIIPQTCIKVQSLLMAKLRLFSGQVCSFSHLLRNCLVNAVKNVPVYVVFTGKSKCKCFST